MNSTYIEKLRNCISIEEVEVVMQGKMFAKSKNSYFEDKSVLLKTSSGKFTKKDITFKNKIYELIFKLLLYLKLDDKLGPRIINSGVLSYSFELRRVLLDIEELKPDIKCFMELDSTTLDMLADKYYHSDTKNTSHAHKTRKIFDWIQYGNQYLPYFLKINPEIILYSTNFQKFQEDARIEKSLTEKLPSRRQPYNLSNLKKLVSFAIDFIENYSDDALIGTIIFLDSHRSNITEGQIYKDQMKKLIELDINFKEPTLMKLQKEVKSDNRFYMQENNVGKRRVLKISSRLITSSRTLEAACLVVIFMTTGMRKSELMRLNRYPKITNDEYYYLKKMTYKTARTEEGEDHEIPIPEITKKSIEILSKIAELKDGKNNGLLISKSLQIAKSNVEETNLDAKAIDLISFLCKIVGIDNPPVPHQFRHAIAFLITRMNQKDGYELARLLLGHKTPTMTFRYLGHYNLHIKNALSELYEEESTFLINEIIDELKDGKKLYGKKGELLTENYQFKGSYADEFTDLLSKNLLELIKKGKLAIIQTPISMCLHDLSRPEEMVCQRGYDMNTLIGSYPAPSTCQAERCSNSIFTESSIEHFMKEIKKIPDDIKERLGKNKFFMENGGFDENLYTRLINKYKKDKEIIKWKVM